MYDPHEHARQLGVHVSWVRGLPERGLWVPDVGTVYLRHGMTRLEERCTLAHELGHAVLGHRESTARHELAADKWAAARLVDAEALEASAAASDDPAQWCRDLDITPRMLLVYLAMREAA